MIKRKKIFVKALISMVMVLSACSHSPYTIPVNNNKPGPVQPGAVQPTANPVQSAAPVQPGNLTPFQYLVSKENPNWSPDGKRVVFNRGYKFYVADAAGTQNTLLADIKKDSPNVM